MDLATTMRLAAERYPHRTAVGGPAPRTYAQWDDHTDHLARGLLDLGARPGGRVLFSLQGGEPLASLHLAAQKAALTSVPLSTRFGEDELSYCLTDAEAELVVVDDAMAPAVEAAARAIETAPRIIHADDVEAQKDKAALPPPPAEDAIGLMLYTSGTTGRPKGVPRSHRAELMAATAHLVQTGQPLGATSLGVMPLFHTMGIRSLLASIICAGTWVPEVKFDAEQAIELIGQAGIDTLYLVPTMYWSLLHTGQLSEARSVRRIAYAGAPMTPALSEDLNEVLEPERIVNHLGSTEIYTFTIGPDGLRKPGCAGRAGIFARVRLVDPDPHANPADLVERGEQGQVIVNMSSPEAFKGYWHRPDADARAIKDGWYFTGDLGTEDEDGDLWVAGRVDDMINSGGENLYPEEIENSLARCPHAERIVIAGTVDEKWGSVVTAFVEPRSGEEPGHVLRQVADWADRESKLPSMKRPKRYIAVDQIPMSAVGKILRRRLVAGEYSVLADSTSGPSNRANP